MRTFISSAVIVMLCQAAPVARADGLFYQLPDDGSWVRFDVTGTSQRDGNQTSTTGTLTMSSVGKTQENGLDCRWIEITRQFHRDDTEFTIVTKLLIPEKYLKKGEAPLDHIVRGWVRFRDNEPREVTSESRAGFARGYLAGPLDEVKKLDKEVVESKLGKLECEGLTGRTKFMSRGGETQATFHLRLHEKAPFGVVQARVESETQRDGQVVRSSNQTYKLVDFGKDAQSKLSGYQ